MPIVCFDCYSFISLPFSKITAINVGLTRTEKSTPYIILSRNHPQEAQILFKSAKN